jgi:hypothetical protein
MIGKAIALLQVPNQRLFSLKAAAQYLGVSPDTLIDHTNIGLILCSDFRGRRAYRLEDLDSLIESLPGWHTRPRMPVPATSPEGRPEHVGR